MSYYYIGQEFGSLSIPNIFIEEYMVKANGTYVKVYLYALKKIRENLKNYSDKDLAKDLELSIEDVDMAWDYWEKTGLIKRINKDNVREVCFIDPRTRLSGFNPDQLEENHKSTDDSYEESPVQISEDDDLEPEVDMLLQAVKMPEISKMFNEIDGILRRETSPFEKQNILSWMTDYNMNPDVIEEAFIYASRDGRKANVNYVGGIIRNWYSAGITNITEVKEYFAENDIRMVEYKQVMKALGSNSNISEHGRLMVDRWRDDYGYSMELILKAFENTTKIQNPNLNYIDKIITDWYQRGVKAIGDIPELPIKKESSKNKFHNFEQRKDLMSKEELEKMMEERRKKALEEESDI